MKTIFANLRSSLLKKSGIKKFWFSVWPNHVVFVAILYDVDGGLSTDEGYLFHSQSFRSFDTRYFLISRKESEHVIISKVLRNIILERMFCIKSNI